MVDFLRSIEQLGLSTWVREGGAIYGYPLILFLHTIGLAIVVGGSAIIDLRLLGVSPQTPVKPLERLFPIIWSGFTLNLISGTILLMADATTKLANPVFYVKMVLVAGGLVVLHLTRKRVFGSAMLEKGLLPPGAKGLAWASLFCWLAAITAGRLLAYIGPVAGLA